MDSIPSYSHEPPPPPYKEHFNFEMVDLTIPDPIAESERFPDYGNKFRCPNSDDCVRGHPDLKLRHIAQVQPWRIAQKLMKAMIGLLLIAWFTVLEVGVHSVRTEAPTPTQKHLAPLLLVLVVLLTIISASAAVSGIHAKTMRRIEDVHYGVEVWKKTAWWVDRSLVNWCLVIISCILVMITSDVVGRWMGKKAADTPADWTMMGGEKTGDII